MKIVVFGKEAWNNWHNSCQWFETEPGLNWTRFFSKCTYVCNVEWDEKHQILEPLRLLLSWTCWDRLFTKLVLHVFCQYSAIMRSQKCSSNFMNFATWPVRRAYFKTPNKYAYALLSSPGIFIRFTKMRQFLTSWYQVNVQKQF